MNVSRETMTRQELFAYIEAEYNVTPDYPWLESPEGAVFRHGDNRKWFCVVMGIQAEKLGLPGNPYESVKLCTEKDLFQKTTAVSEFMRDLRDVSNGVERDYTYIKKLD